VIAVPATALFAANPAVLSLATDILSETPFVFFTLLGLYLVDRGEGTQTTAENARITSNERPGWFTGALRALRVHRTSVYHAALLVAAGLALGAAYYMRTAELAILAAAPLFLVLKRRVRAGIALAAFLAAFALPWFLRSSAPPSPETPFFARSYIHQVLTEAPYSDKTVSVLGLAERVISNSWDYLGRILPETLFPHLPSLGAAAPFISAAIAVLLVLGFALEVRRGLRVGELAVAAYWLSLSLFVWVLGYRYVILILPFAILYLLIAVEWIVTNSFARRHTVAAPAARPSTLALLLISGLLMLSSLAVDARRAERNLLTTRRQTLAQTYADNLEWTSYLGALDWIRENTAGDAVIMARKPELVYLLSSHRALEYPYTQDGSILMSTVAAGQVSYILEDAFTWTRTTETYLAPAMRALPAAFTLVHETPPPRTRIWQVSPSR
jgi:hypothetical protein